MSADVWINQSACEHCGRSANERADLNVTYNLSSMLRDAGFMGWSEIVGRPAREVGWHVLSVLNGMQEDPETWRAMNPANGWGDYDECLQGRMREWAVLATQAGPNDTIGGGL